MLVPPKLGNPPLPWKLLPRWLRFLRVLLLAAWASGLSCLATLFYLQVLVLRSPTVPVGRYHHPVAYKEGTFYLSEPLFNVWNALQLAVIPLVVAGVSLIFVCNTFEYRIKRLLWDTEPGDL